MNDENSNEFEGRKIATVSNAKALTVIIAYFVILAICFCRGCIMAD